MKTTILSVLVAFAGLIVLGCGGGSTPAPVSQRIAKIWSANKVDQNSTTVYTKGGTGNVVDGYKNFKIDLSNSTTVRYTEEDANTFVGTWSVPSDTRLVFSGLTPAPSGTNGTIEFTITTLTDNSLVLARTTASQKTGGTINTYTLSNP